MDLEKEKQLFIIQEMNRSYIRNNNSLPQKRRYNLLNPCLRKKSKYQFDMPILHCENPKEYQRIYRQFYWDVQDKL